MFQNGQKQDRKNGTRMYSFWFQTALVLGALFAVATLTFGGSDVEKHSIISSRSCRRRLTEIQDGDRVRVLVGLWRGKKGTVHKWLTKNNAPNKPDTWNMWGVELDNSVRIAFLEEDLEIISVATKTKTVKKKTTKNDAGTGVTKKVAAKTKNVAAKPKKVAAKPKKVAKKLTETNAGATGSKISGTDKDKKTSGSKTPEAPETHEAHEAHETPDIQEQKEAKANAAEKLKNEALRLKQAKEAKDKSNNSDNSDESFFKKYMGVFIVIAIVVVVLCCGCIAGVVFCVLSKKDDDSSDDSSSSSQSAQSRPSRSSRFSRSSARNDSFSDRNSFVDDIESGFWDSSRASSDY